MKGRCSSGPAELPCFFKTLGPVPAISKVNVQMTNGKGDGKCKGKYEGNKNDRGKGGKHSKFGDLLAYEGDGRLHAMHMEVRGLLSLPVQNVPEGSREVRAPPVAQGATRHAPHTWTAYVCTESEQESQLSFSFRRQSTE